MELANYNHLSLSRELGMARFILSSLIDIDLLVIGCFVLDTTMHEAIQPDLYRQHVWQACIQTRFLQVPKRQKQ